MPGILVGRGPLLVSAERIFRNADERGKRAVVECVRQRVAGIEVEILACRLVHLKSAAVINRISRQIIATDQTRRITRDSAVIVLAVRIARRCLSSRITGIVSARNSLDWAEVQQRRTQQVMRSDEKISGTDRKSISDIAIDFKVRLKGIR